jgi:hypothetical protein
MLNAPSGRDCNPQNTALPTASSQSTQLCARCSSIDFEEITREGSQSPMFREGQIDLGSGEALAASVCALCQLFSKCNTSRDRTKTCYLRRRLQAIDVDPTGLRILDDDVFLFFVDDTVWRPNNEYEYFCIYQPTRVTSQFGVRLVSREFFDFSFATSCLDCCEALGT